MIFNPSGSFSLLFPPARTALEQEQPQNLHEKIKVSRSMLSNTVLDSFSTLGSSVSEVFVILNPD
jgi:hypothetical protein